MSRYDEIRTKPSVEDGIMWRSECSSGYTTMVDYQPGNGTRYIVSITDFTTLSDEAKSTLGYGPPMPVPLFQVTRLNGGFGMSMVFGERDEISWREFQKCGVTTAEADAVVLAELVGHLTGLKAELPRWATEPDPVCRDFTDCDHPCTSCLQSNCLCAGGDGRYKRCAEGCNRYGETG